MLHLFLIMFMYSNTPPPTIDKLNNQEKRCLIRTTYHESKGEPIIGKMFVAQVTLNRVKSGKFPNSVCKVIKQKGAYQWYSSLPRNLHQVKPANSIQQESYEQIKFTVSVLEVLNSFGIDVTKGALYFHSTSIKPNKFFKKLKRLYKVNNHLFYK